VSRAPFLTAVQTRHEAREPASLGDAAGLSSVTHRVNAERLVLLGWTRAILLQFAHPLVAEGVFDHSGFRASPRAAASRLRHTVKAMLALAFGDEREREAAIAGIRAIHRRVHGRLASPVGPFPAGTRYSAEDPALVLWVHATVLESVLLVHERLVGPLSPAEHDLYCEDAAPVALALGAEPAAVPRTRAGLDRYLDASYQSGAIVVGPHARELAAALLRPQPAALLAPASWVNQTLTIGLLPEAVRAQYGFEWTPGRARALALILGGLRLARRATPGWAAHWRAARR
jgi:uncharacterized protein (DUF2236 family)